MERLDLYFGVDSEFWLVRTTIARWFRLEDSEKHFPALASTRLKSTHFRHKSVGPKELKLLTLQYPVGNKLEPETGSARVLRSAGTVIPLERLLN